MRQGIAGFTLAIIVAAFGAGGFAAGAAESPSAEATSDATADVQARVSADGGVNAATRLDRLEAEVIAAEDISAIKRLQRAYGYYLDKGMWDDLAAFFTDDAIANYPAGVFIGHDSIRRHLFMNVGGGKVGDIGLGNDRLYNHMSIQPVVHLDPGGESAKGRWRAFAMFGSFGGNATWAEGVYEMQYAKVNGVWKIRRLDYYAGFGAPYVTGWVVPEPAQTPAPRPRRALAHPPDRERNTECEGFPAACIAPFHYENPSRASGGDAWDVASIHFDVHNVAPAGGNRAVTGQAALHNNGVASGNGAARNATALRARAANLLQRAQRLSDEQSLENLQRIYGYYVDRNMWDHVADLFADNATMEMAQQGVYVNRKRIRRFLDTWGPQGATDGVLNDHIQLQPIVDVAPDGKTARIRSRELGMTGTYNGSATWSEGVYENTFVKQRGVWKFQSLHFYPTFITDYDKGWAKDAHPAPTASTQLPPDRPPSQRYEIFPQAHVPPFHYRNPVTGEPPHYPKVGGPDGRTAAAALEPEPGAARLRATGESTLSPPRTRTQATTARTSNDIDAAMTSAAHLVARVKDFVEVENLTSAYGYYLERPRRSVLARWHHRARAAGRLQNPAARARVPDAGVRPRQGRPGRGAPR